MPPRKRPHRPRRPFVRRPVNPNEPIRVRLPKEGEVLGTVIQSVGGGRIQVDCQDGQERLCRIPGKIRRRLWVRSGDIVVTKPWAINGETRADIVWRYNFAQANWLKEKGYVK